MTEPALSLGVESARPVRVAVFLGTDHHPYDRAVQWAMELAGESGGESAGDADQHWFVQYGFTHWPDARPTHLTGSQMLGIGELNDLMASVDVVITHGGPGLIMEARAARHVPIVIPRDPALGEHVDGHQMDFCARLSDEGSIIRATSLDGLREAIRGTLERGRPESAGAGHSSETVTRFAALVEESRTRPRKSLLRRR